MFLATLEKIVPKLPALVKRFNAEPYHIRFAGSTGTDVNVTIGALHVYGKYVLQFDSCGVLKSIHKHWWSRGAVESKSIPLCNYSDIKT